MATFASSQDVDGVGVGARSPNAVLVGVNVINNFQTNNAFTASSERIVADLLVVDSFNEVEVSLVEVLGGNLA